MSIPVRSVYYDGACPLCAREMERYASLRGAAGVRFVDIAGPRFDPAREGLAGRDYGTYLHARRGDGVWLVGVDAFLGLWETLPALRPLAAAARLGPVKALLSAAYRLFAPLRPRLPFRRPCDPGGACRPGPAPLPAAAGRSKAVTSL